MIKNMKYPVMSGLAFIRQIAEVNEIHLYNEEQETGLLLMMS